MILDLHVWGTPSGAVVSIDAECLAAITYLHHSLTPSQVEWRLVPSNDPSISPTNRLPALNHDGHWTSGFTSILSYLTSASLGQPLDSSLTALQRADAAAYRAFLSSTAQPLLDVYLYLSAANWSAFTRPLLSQLLPFPLTWTVPPLLRSEAATRVDHLGLSELDADFDPNSGLHLSTGRASLPETFRKHIPAAAGGKPSVREEMTPEQAVAIKLHGLAEDCLGVLEGVVQVEKQEGGVGRIGMLDVAQVTSLDCLVYGHLAIMERAPVPRRFLGEFMEDHAPRLVRLVDQIDQATAAVGPLPWSENADTRSLSAVGGRTVDSILRHVPGLGEHYAQEIRHRAERDLKGIDGRTIILTVGLLATSTALGYSYYLYKSLQPFGLRYQTWTARKGGPRLMSQFGELGSMLNSVLGAEAPVGGATEPSSRIGETDSDVE